MADVAVQRDERVEAASSRAKESKDHLKDRLSDPLDSATHGTLKERGTDKSQDELDRRTPEDTGTYEDGSGDHGSEDPTLTDYANEQFWYKVAAGADGMGLVNAARHMRHYLDGGGALSADADTMLRDDPSLDGMYEMIVEQLREQADDRILSDPTSDTPFTLTSDKENHYFSKSASKDWYFAVGGCTVWVEATVTPNPPDDQCGAVPATMDATLHVFDRYNWDEGKSVTIAGLVVKDEQLGHLHKVGLAKEFEVHATSSVRAESWTSVMDTGSDSSEYSVAGDLKDSRMDPTR